MKRQVATAVGLLFLVASWVSAEEWQDALQREINRQKDEWNEGYEADGEPVELRETGQYSFETLAQGEPWEQTVDLVPAREYVIMAVCDSDCYDIDLYAFDRERGILADDTYEDAVPVVEFVATDGEQYVEVEMLDCQVDLCYVAIGVFEKAERGGR